MMLCSFGPRRLSPSLVVLQVRHALSDIRCPDPESAPARAGSWGTAEDDSRIRNVEQASPTIGIQGMKASIPNVCPAIERAVATISSSVCEIAGMRSAVRLHNISARSITLKPCFAEVNQGGAMVPLTYD